MRLASQWFRAFLNPKRVFIEERNNASLKKTLAGVAIATLILLVYLVASFLTIKPFTPPQPTLAEAMGNAVLFFYLFLLTIIIPIIIYPFLFIIAGVLFYIIGLILYKKGSIKTQYYLFSLFQPALMFFLMVFGFIFSILSISVAWILLITFLYSLYLDFKATKANFNA